MLNFSTMTLGIVGGGLMGRGIAQIALAAGIPVILFDQRKEALALARAEIDKGLRRQAHKEGYSADSVERHLSRLTLAERLQDLASCQVVIEAIVESLSAKQSLFEQIEDIVATTAVLATNTSSLLVTEVGANCRHPERFGGLHFFSPVPRMKIAEVIGGERTAPAVVDALEALTRKLGHHPVRARDTPGFIVNHAGRAYGPESLRIASEQVAGFATIDRVLREACGFKMGPFELFDLTGLDISHPAGESIYHQFYEEPRFRPSPITRLRLAGGLLGRKSGSGFYPYDAEGRRIDPPESTMPTTAGMPVWIGPCEIPGKREAVLALLERAGAAIVSDPPAAPRSAAPLRAADVLCILLPVGDDATQASVQAGVNARWTVTLDPLFLEGRRTLMCTPLTDTAARDLARRLLSADGTQVAVINDSPGFIAQRVCAAIVNIACDMAQQGIASPTDIDQAVRLGLGYPKGPFELGDHLGASVVMRILDGLYTRYRDPRYRPSPWLSRRAALGISLLHPDARE